MSSRCNFWHSEGWIPRNEALLEAQTPVVGANMCPEDFQKSLWFQRDRMHVVAPKEASTCRSKCPVSFVVERETRRCRNGMSRSCQRCCLVTVEEGHQEEA